jgi:adenylosuccinate lyase
LVPRYECKDISRIWSDENKFDTFLKVELALLESLEEAGERIPRGTAKAIRDVCCISVERIEQIERETRHDVVAFCRHITEQVDLETGRWFHWGATSSDIIDTSLSLQIVDSLHIVLKEMNSLISSIQDLVDKSKSTLVIGRSHGMNGEPMLLAQKWMGHLTEFTRRRDDLTEYLETECTTKCSGAVGNYTVLSPKVESLVAKKLGLRVEDHSTQVIPRDRIAKLISIGALYAAALERLCVEIRHMSRSEVGEVREGFVKGQAGSSTMPHKKNPISCENLTGIARVMRSHLHIALENCVLWHERDISHSSSERLFLPDHFGLWVYSLRRMKSVIDNLEIDHNRMVERVMSSPESLSSLYLHQILQRDHLEFLTREEVYEVIQRVSFEGHKTHREYRERIVEELGVALPPLDYESLLKMYSEKFEETLKRNKNISV